MTGLPPQTSVPPISFENVYTRLIAQLPPWFGNTTYAPLPFNDEAPYGSNFQTILWAFIAVAFENYLLFQYDWLQTRIGAYEIQNDPNFPIPPPIYPVADGDNLDLISQDFFGNLLPRRPGESDDNYRNRILANVMKLKATRPAMMAALIALVTPVFEQAGLPVVPPIIIESGFPSLLLGYNDYPLSYNRIGAYASTLIPYTATIIVFLPITMGMGTYPGYSTFGEVVTWGEGLGDPSIVPSTPAIDIPPMWFGSDTLLNYYITLQDILNVVNLTKVLGTQINVIIQYVPN